MSEDLNKHFGVDFVEDGSSGDTDIVKVDETLKELSEFEKKISKIRENLDVDYDKMRGVLDFLVEKGRAAVDSAFDVADRSQQPRAYEVLSILIKSTADVTKDLMETHKGMLEVESVSSIADDSMSASVQNNTFFIGTTHELLDAIESSIKSVNSGKRGKYSIDARGEKKSKIQDDLVRDDSIIDVEVDDGQ
jgi:hypothetical protein